MKRFGGDPYRNFMLAIIERAVKDCVRKRKLIEQDKDWKNELINDPDYYLFESVSDSYPSFLCICEILSYPPGRLRKEIKAYLGEPEQTGLSKIDKIKIKIRDAGIIQRYRLTRYASDSLKLNCRELDVVLMALITKELIRVEKRMTKRERWATFYIWEV